MDQFVSVIIPAHNSGAHLRATIESVLGQTHSHLELIVVDDGSSDDSARTAAAYGPRVHVIRQPRAGHPAARNTGVRAARGAFLSFVDHDDLWSPGKLERQLACFAGDPSLDLVFGHARNFFSEELGPDERSRLRVPLHPLPGLLQGSLLARTASFHRVGMFPEDRPVGDFIDWYGRAMCAGMRTHMLPDVVLHRRIHRSNHQRLHRERVGQGYLKAVKELLDRRRAR